MMRVWVCQCKQCGREIADQDRLAFDFKRGDWRYLASRKEWICGDCAEKQDAEQKGGAR